MCYSHLLSKRKARLSHLSVNAQNWLKGTVVPLCVCLLAWEESRAYSMTKGLQEMMLEISEGSQVPSTGTIMSSSTYQARILGFLKKKNTGIQIYERNVLYSWGGWRRDGWMNSLASVFFQVTVKRVLFVESEWTEYILYQHFQKKYYLN